MTHAELVLPPTLPPVLPARSPERAATRTRERPANAPLVVLREVCKRYAGQAADRYALQDVSLAVAPGEIFGIIGRSGAGKSTLVRTINRLEEIDSGHLEVDGQPVAQLDASDLVALRRQVGMVFQHFNLLSAKTVAQNVGLPLRVAGVPGAEIEARVDALLRLVGLADKRNARPSQLSGGQKQRVGIARALVHQPRLLLCDEATSALDPETTQSILALLRDINRQLGLTIILITHEFDVVRAICDRVAVMEHGRIVESGEVWRVFGNPRHAVTAALLTPTLQAIPAELGQRLLATPPAGDFHSVVSVRYRGNGSGTADLDALVAGVGAGVKLLHAGLENVRGYLYGRLLLSVPGPYHPVSGAGTAAAGDLDPIMETIGYVTSTA